MARDDALRKDLSVLQIDRSQKESLEPARRSLGRIVLYAGTAVILVVIAGLALYRTLAGAAEVEVQRPGLEAATTAGEVVLTAGGYIVAHHPIQVSSKVVGKVAWVGIEKGDRVKEGQVLVRLEDDEYQAQLAQTKANLGVAQAKLKELESACAPAFLWCC